MARTRWTVTRRAVTRRSLTGRSISRRTVSGWALARPIPGAWSPAFTRSTRSVTNARTPSFARSIPSTRSITNAWTPAPARQLTGPLASAWSLARTRQRRSLPCAGSVLKKITSRPAGGSRRETSAEAWPRASGWPLQVQKTTQLALAWTARRSSPSRRSRSCAWPSAGRRPRSCCRATTWPLADRWSCARS